MTGLEALKQVKNFLGYNYCSVDLPNELELIEKFLKALEIIKEKECDMRWLKYCIKEYKAVEVYNDGLPEYYEKLTQEEFNLLRSVLE